MQGINAIAFIVERERASFIPIYILPLVLAVHATLS